MKRYYGSTAVDRTMTVSEVALAAIRKHFAGMLENESGTIEGVDPEKLHDMRVATRRMRAAYGVFGRWLSDDLNAFSQELKWIGGVLGRVRDLDVQIAHQREWARILGNEEALEAWFAMMAATREESRMQLVSDLRSERYASLVRNMGDALIGAAPIHDAPSVLEAAPPLIRKRWRKLKSAMAAVDDASPDQLLHQARILAKRFRYSVEFVTPVYGPLAKDVSTATAKLQDVLGLHQDCAVAKQMAMERLAAAGTNLPPNACFELGRLVSHADAVKSEQRKLAGPAFDAIRRGPWSLLKGELVASATEALRQPQEE